MSIIFSFFPSFSIVRDCTLPFTPTISPFLQYSLVLEAILSNATQSTKSVSYNPSLFLKLLGIAKEIVATLIPLSDLLTTISVSYTHLRAHET